MTVRFRYVPILRSKAGELYAIEHLSQVDRGVITPLIEVIPTLFTGRVVNKVKLPDPDPGKVLHGLAKKLLRSCGYDCFLLDAQHIDGRVADVCGMHPLAYLARYCSDFRFSMVPVTSLTRSSQFQAAVRGAVQRNPRGLCIRLRWRELQIADFGNLLASFVRDFGINRADVDLVIDYGSEVENAPPPMDLIAALPFLPQWRNVVIAGGTFPKDLQEYTPGIHRRHRTEWLTWKQMVAGANISRVPGYSDYAVQFGEYVEPVPGSNPSASVRYTVEDEWVIFRGEALRRKSKDEQGPGAEQWVGHALLLRDSGEFYGPAFSDGDGYIHQMSQKRTRPFGNPQTWIRAGLNHHMTVAARQVSRLLGA